MDEFHVLLDTPCRKCTYRGEYSDREGNQHLGIAFIQKENQLSIKRYNIRFRISISTAAGKKEVTITADADAPFARFWPVLTDILRFESLFDGCFFPVVALSIDDDKDYASIVKPRMLAYYESKERYSILRLSLSDSEYRRRFFAWKKFEKKVDIIAPVFLYAAYTNGLTVDHRMALLLQVFEPIALIENKCGSLPLIRQPYLIYSRRCPSCGITLKRQVKNKELHFEDELNAIIRKYGTIIFDGDSKRRILKKAVASRNAIAHVVTDKAVRKKGFTAGQCGFYIRKFILLYRYIVFCNLGLDESLLDGFLRDSVSSLNSQFPQLRIV